MVVAGGGQLSAMPGMPGMAARPLPARSANGSRGIGEGRAGRGNIAVRLWRSWRGLRAALGWRATAAGLGVAVGLAGSSWWVLKDDVAGPLGGWLWAGSLAALVVADVGVE